MCQDLIRKSILNNMSHTVLIPIDFKVESLKSLKLVLNDNTHQKINVVLVYAEKSSGSITDMLFYSPSKRVSELCSEVFIEAVSMIKNRYDSVIGELRIEIFGGTTVSALKNFIDANKIDEIISPSNYEFKMDSKAFDLRPLFKGTGTPIKNISWQNQKSLSAHEQLIALFN
jgi:hypothetical protein